MTATIPALMRAAANQHRDRAALRSQADGAISYRELDRQADLVAKALIVDATLPGDRAAIWAPRRRRYIRSCRAHLHRETSRSRPPGG